MSKNALEHKRLAGESAADQVESGMVVGLGFGSTAIHALRAIARKIESGELQDILGIPTADSIEQEAREAGIPLSTLEEVKGIDLTIDGADEVDPQLNLIKGGGGALLREKIVAQASHRLLIVVDETKLSGRLGTLFPVPVEVLPFGWASQLRFLEGLGAKVSIRSYPDGSHFRTDNGNLILDCSFGPIEDAQALSSQLAGRAGIVEHGLFLDLTDQLIIGGLDGIKTQIREKD